MIKLQSSALAASITSIKTIFPSHRTPNNYNSQDSVSHSISHSSATACSYQQSPSVAIIYHLYIMHSLTINSSVKRISTLQLIHPALILLHSHTHIIIKLKEFSMICTKQILSNNQHIISVMGRIRQWETPAMPPSSKLKIYRQRIKYSVLGG